jgi:hypothetical protein
VLNWFWQNKGAFNVLHGQQPQTLAHAGHYSAHTNPDQLAADIRAFFRPLRSAPTTNQTSDRTINPASKEN